MCSDLSVLPLPVWGEGWGEGVTERSLDHNPSPHPSPSRSRIYPTSADLMRRTRVNPSSVGEGAERACCPLTTRRYDESAWPEIEPSELALLRYPTHGRLARFGEGAGRASGSALRRGDALGAADDGDEHAAAEQSFGHALGIVQRHGIDQARAAIDIIDAEIVDLHLHELARDPVRR